MASRTLLTYGLILGAAMALLAWADQAAGTGLLGASWYSGVIGLVFLVLGLWLGKWGRREKGRGEAVKTERREEEGVIRLENAQKPAPSDLSERELEVLQHLAAGKTNKEIGEAMFISENTVKTHLQNLYSKLDVRRRTQAVARGRALGLVG